MASPSPVPSRSAAGPLALVGRHPRSLVGDLQLEPFAGRSDGQLDPAAHGGNASTPGAPDPVGLEVEIILMAWNLTTMPPPSI
jgi:hypothetical protein